MARNRCALQAAAGPVDVDPLDVRDAETNERLARLLEVGHDEPEVVDAGVGVVVVDGARLVGLEEGEVVAVVADVDAGLAVADVTLPADVEAEEIGVEGRRPFGVGHGEVDVLEVHRGPPVRKVNAFLTLHPGAAVHGADLGMRADR